MINEKGFTLTEVLVALIIFSVVATPLTISFTKAAKSLGCADKIFAIRYAESALLESLTDKTEQYDTSIMISANDKNYRLVRRVEEGNNRTIIVEVFLNRKQLAVLKGYSAGNL